MVVRMPSRQQLLLGSLSLVTYPKRTVSQIQIFMGGRAAPQAASLGGAGGLFRTLSVDQEGALDGAPLLHSARIIPFLGVVFSVGNVFSVGKILKEKLPKELPLPLERGL